MNNNKQIGRIGLVKAIEYFTIEGYTVSLPLNDTQYYDLIVEKDSVLFTVQCKATRTEDCKIDFRATGGTNGAVYGNVLDSAVDYLFCVDKDLNCYLIPKRDLIDFGNRNSITLRTTVAKNKQGFPGYKYLVVNGLVTL